MDDIKFPEINFVAFEKLEAAINQFACVVVTTLVPLAEKIAAGLNNLYNVPPELYHQIGLLHPRELMERYYRDKAEPDEVVDYIIRQPNYTWNGVTIYPDEAWRYRCKSDWMWWRQS